MKDVDASLLGRRTYVTHAEAFEPNLVDELHLLLYPLTLGGGKRVLPSGLMRHSA